MPRIGHFRLFAFDYLILFDLFNDLHIDDFFSVLFINLECQFLQICFFQNDHFVS